MIWRFRNGFLIRLLIRKRRIDEAFDRVRKINHSKPSFVKSLDEVYILILSQGFQYKTLLSYSQDTPYILLRYSLFKAYITPIYLIGSFRFFDNKRQG